jgi:molybdenum cofactor cytidylyltransferase
LRAAIILAAGRSQRFGTSNKLLVRRRGKTLLRSAIESALSAPVGRVIVVTGADNGRIRNAVHAVGNPRVSTLFAPDHRHGHRASLLRGLRDLRQTEREALIFLGDMPAIPSAIGLRLAKAPVAGIKAVRPSYRGQPGHPVLIRDIGTVRDRLEQGKPPFHRDEVRHIETGRWAVLDIDRPGDLRRNGITG